MSMEKPANKPDVTQSAYKLGYNELGSIFVCFSHLLLRHARQMDCQRLAFVSRDGDLLMRCTERLAKCIGGADWPAFSYVHASRQASFLPALKTIEKSALEVALEIRGERASLSAALTYLGMPLMPISAILARLAIDPYRSDISPEAISILVGDEQFRLAVRQESDRQKALLAAYLEQEHIGNGIVTLLVDIGWRGSILTNINSAFSGTAGFEPLAGAFFGLWSEDKSPSGFPAGTVGVLADIRRRRNVLEAAAWFSAFLLEAICRANEGTTVGYEPRGEKIEPILAGDSESRRAEDRVMPLVAEIRRGIMNFIDEHGASDEWLAASEKQLRKHAQRSLLRLACFPRAGEIAVGAQLVHTEGHTPDWWAHLIDSPGISPISHPLRWIAGLASPWRAGYIRHTGGPVLALGFLLLESALLAVSPNARSLLTRVARRAAGGANRPSLEWRKT